MHQTIELNKISVWRYGDDILYNTVRHPEKICLLLLMATEMDKLQNAWIKTNIVNFLALLIKEWYKQIDMDSKWMSEHFKYFYDL